MLAVTRPLVTAAAQVQVDASSAAAITAAVHALPVALSGSAVFRQDRQNPHARRPNRPPRASGAVFSPQDQSVFVNAASQPVQPLAKGLALSLAVDPSAAVPNLLAGVVVFPNGRAYSIHAAPGAIPAAAPPSTPSASPGWSRSPSSAASSSTFMPCVFPVLFIKGLSLLQSSPARAQPAAAPMAGSTRSASWSPSGPLSVSCSALRAAGHQLGWWLPVSVSGVLSPSWPYFSSSSALSLAGQFEIGLSLTSQRRG